MDACIKKNCYTSVVTKIKTFVYLFKTNQLADIQRHYNELLSNKEIDVQTLRAQVQELVEANKRYSERLVYIFISINIADYFFCGAKYFVKT